MKENRKQKTENRKQKQKTENRKQKTKNRKQKTENKKQKTKNKKQKKNTMQGVEVVGGVEGQNQFSPPAPSVWYVCIHRPLKASKVRSTQQDSLSVSV